MLNLLFTCSVGILPCSVLLIVCWWLFVCRYCVVNRRWWYAPDGWPTASDTFAPHVHVRVYSLFCQHSSENAFDAPNVFEMRTKNHYLFVCLCVFVCVFALVPIRPYIRTNTVVVWQSMFSLDVFASKNVCFVLLQSFRTRRIVWVLLQYRYNLI